MGLYRDDIDAFNAYIGKQENLMEFLATPEYLLFAQEVVPFTSIKIHNYVRILSLNTGYATASNEWLGIRAQCSESHARKAIADLITQGFLEVFKKGRLRCLKISTNFLNNPHIMGIINKEINTQKEMRAELKNQQNWSNHEHPKTPQNQAFLVQMDQYSNNSINTGNTTYSLPPFPSEKGAASPRACTVETGSKVRLRRDQLPQANLGSNKPTVGFKAKGHIEPNTNLAPKVHVRPDMKIIFDAWNNSGRPQVRPDTITFDRRCKILRRVLGGTFFTNLGVAIPEQYRKAAEDIALKKLTVTHFKIAIEKFSLVCSSDNYRKSKDWAKKVYFDDFFYNPHASTDMGKFLFLHFLTFDPEPREATPLVKDNYPVLTESLIIEYTNTFLAGIRPKLDNHNMNGFIRATQQLVDFYNENKSKWTAAIKPHMPEMPALLVRSLASTYQDKGLVVQLGHLFSKTTFSIVLPQWMYNQGYCETNWRDDNEEQRFVDKHSEELTHFKKFRELVATGKKADGTYIDEATLFAYQTVEDHHITAGMLRYIGVI